jgi:hypothetical protein
MPGTNSRCSSNTSGRKVRSKGIHIMKVIEQFVIAWIQNDEVNGPICAIQPRASSFGVPCFDEPVEMSGSMFARCP